MRDTLINRYSAEGKTEDIVFVPKLNTRLFTEGNGLPVLKREVHTYTDNMGRYREIGCSSTDEHSCLMCKHPKEFKKMVRAYIAVAVINRNAEQTFEMALMSFSYGVYLDRFRDVLLSSDNGVYLKLTYPDTDSYVNKIHQQSIELITDTVSLIECKEDFEGRVLKEFKSIDELDIQLIRPEFRRTSYDRMAELVKLNTFNTNSSNNQ